MRSLAQDTQDDVAEVHSFNAAVEMCDRHAIFRQCLNQRHDQSCEEADSVTEILRKVVRALSSFLSDACRRPGR